MMQHANDNHLLTFLSVCSGIEAASQAWPHWRPVAFSEIEKFPSAVLAHHYPDVPNLGDFTKIDTRTLGRVDVLCGGTPCQAFSVAGLRKGLEDERGNLTLKFVELAHELADGNGLRNVVWENVYGVLSDKGNAFGCFLAGLVGADAPIVPPRRWTNAGMVSGPRGRAAWRVLDAQYFGVAQRRRRVIVVADFGNGADPAAVLLIEQGLPRHPPARGEAGKDVAGTAKGGAGVGSEFDVAGTMKAMQGSGGWSNSVDHAASGYMLPVYAPDIARCDATREGSSQDYETTTMVAVTPIDMRQASRGATMTNNRKEGSTGGAPGTGIGDEGDPSPTISTSHPPAICVTGQVTHSLTAEGHDASEDGSGRGAPIIAFSAKDYGADASFDLSPTLRSGNHSGSHANGGVMPAIAWAPETYSTLSASEGGTMTQIMPIVTSAVRRLTPTECERLQGFPDGYTDIPWRGKPNSPDGPRYKALGNSWAVPKFTWLGRRLEALMPVRQDIELKEAA